MTHADEHPPLEILSAHMDGEIAAPEVPALEEHLSRCKECRERLDDLRVLAAATAGQETPPVPAGLAARISARLEEEPAAVSTPPPMPRGSRRRHLPPWLWRGGPLAAAASFLGAAILWRVWLAGPAPVEPLKTVAPSAPAIQQILSPEEARGASRAESTAVEEKMRAEDDRHPGAGSREPAAEASPMGKMKVKGLEEYADSPPPAAPPPVDKKERRKAAGERSARQDAVSPGAVQGFAFDEPAATAHEPLPEKDAAKALADDQLLDRDALQSAAFSEKGTAAPILLQMKEKGAGVRLDLNGDLQVEAAGYRCRIRIDMDGLVVPEPADEAASRDILLHLVRERYRAELENQCGPLPAEFTAPPRS